MKFNPTSIVVVLLLAIGLGCGYSRPAAAVPPGITSLAPASTTAGGPAFALAVNGSSFSANSVVYWNTTPRTTTLVNSGQVTAAISATDIATAGTAMVYVRTSGGAYGGGTNSNIVNFTVN